jgi:PAS domain S-box-containing protein
MSIARPEWHDEGVEAEASFSESRAHVSFFPDEDTVYRALQGAGIGIWSWDIASNKVTWSSNLESIHRLPPGSFDGTFAFVQNDVHPDDRPHVMATIQEALRARGSRRMLYRLPPRDGDEEYWIESIASVVIEDGAVVGMLGTCRNVSERVRLHRELRIRASQQQAVARLGERALTESSMQQFLDDAIATVADTLDVPLAKILELIPGDAELLLRAGVGWKPGLVGTAHVSTGPDTQAGYSLTSGGPVVVLNLATEVRFRGHHLLHSHGVVSGVTIPIAGRDGRSYGVLGVHTNRQRPFTDYDVSFLDSVATIIAGAIQRRQLDQRHELMIRELRHRSGNLFSQLLALFSQTAKNSKNLAELVPKYEARVLALANAHRLVAEGGWKSASLMELLNTLLAPYLDRITFAGPNVFLEADPTFGLSMAIHELATNATKYGSLSYRSGRVEVTWQVKRTDRGLALIFGWIERDGPPPKRQRRQGFGSRLIHMVVERQLNGNVRSDFGAGGLEVELIVPLTHERWPGNVARTPLADDSDAALGLASYRADS